MCVVDSPGLGQDYVVMKPSRFSLRISGVNHPMKGVLAPLHLNVYIACLLTQFVSFLFVAIIVVTRNSIGARI